MIESNGNLAEQADKIDRHYELVYPSVLEAFPDMINEVHSTNDMVVHFHQYMTNMVIRYNGNIVMHPAETLLQTVEDDEAHVEWARGELAKITRLREHISSLGYEPKFDSTTKLRDGRSWNPYYLKMIYEFPAGICEVVHKKNGRSEVMRSMNLCDKLFVGFTRYNWDGRLEEIV